jgi:tetratricopeptide (TPR) repeat protein
VGTWGNGPFDDDVASDWAWEFEEATDWGVVEVALRRAADVSADSDLGASSGQIAWAAATVVAAVDDPAISLPGEISDWLSRFGEARPHNARALALGALRRVLGDKSELAELWRESGEEDTWRARVEEVAAVLDGAVEERVADAPEPTLTEPDAMTLADQGENFSRDGEHELAIERWDLFLDRVGKASDPAVRERVARVMFGKADALFSLDRLQEALEAYDAVVQCLGEAPEPPFREMAAHALYMKAGLTGEGESGSLEAAIELFELVAERFGDAPERDVRGTVGSALNAKGKRLERLGRRDEAIEAYDLAVERCDNASDPWLREIAQRARNYKAKAEGRTPDGSAT